MSGWQGRYVTMQSTVRATTSPGTTASDADPALDKWQHWCDWLDAIKAELYLEDLVVECWQHVSERMPSLR